MTNVRKRISELTALTSASLDTTLVGVDGGTTYKIELDTLADAVTSRVNILDRDRLNSLESVTSSFETKGRSVVSSSAQITNLGFISTSVNISALNSFTSSQNTLNTAFTNGISSRLQTSSFNDFSSSVNQRILDATNEQSFNGLISGSSQLTSSYDSRYVLSGSITQTTWDNIANKPSGIVSQSTDLSSLNSFTASQSILNTVFTNGVSARLQTSSFNEYTASQSTSSLVNRLNAIENVSGSWITESETGSFLTSLNGAISSSTQLTASFDTRYILSGSVSSTPAGTISGSSQLTASFDTRYLNTSGDGVISGSSQLTSSLDTRYAASGSVDGVTPAGTISGSSQLTSSFDGRYVQTGSFNTLTASFNSFTASAQSVTTGSNSFNGTQTITGSLIVTSGSFIGSQLTANTSSLYLTSGSNLYVQNNGLVEITGSLVITGSVNIISTNALQIGTGSGDEGGEILLVKSQTNNSLTGSGITIDSFQNKIRIFEQGGNARGVSIDLSKTPNGVGGELLWKAGGLVNADVDVTLGNLKARIPSTGNRSLQLSTVSGTYSVYGSGVYSFSGISGTTINSGSPLSITTTPAYIIPSYNFTVAGAVDTWTLMDTSAGIAWRITMIIGASYNNNMISIERLV